ncbi:MAG: hypothetical protein AAF267_06020 [Deinococcota bacterium]
MPSRCILHSPKPITTPFSLLGYQVEAVSSGQILVDDAAPDVTRDDKEQVHHLDSEVVQQDHLIAPDPLSSYTHQLIVTIPDAEAPAVIASTPSTTSNNAEAVPETTSRLDDLLLLLSLAHGHDIVRVRHTSSNVVTPDSVEAETTRNLHHYTFGRVFAAGLGHHSTSFDEHPYTRLEYCYATLQSSTWQRFYNQGHYLRLMQSLAQQTSLTAALNHAGLLLEHLFALHNAHWLTTHHVRTLTPLEKLSFLVASYVLATETHHADEITQPSTAPVASNQQRLKRYAQVLNQLVHHAHVPSGSSQAALSLISLIEYCCLAALYDSRSTTLSLATALPDNAPPQEQPSLPRFRSLRQFEDICRDPVALVRHLHTDNTEVVTSAPS